VIQFNKAAFWRLGMTQRSSTMSAVAQPGLATWPRSGPALKLIQLRGAAMIGARAVAIVAEGEFAHAQAAIGDMASYCEIMKIGSARAGVSKLAWQWQGATQGWLSSTSRRSLDGALGLGSPPTNARSTRSLVHAADESIVRGIRESADGLTRSRRAGMSRSCRS